MLIDPELSLLSDPIDSDLTQGHVYAPFSPEMDDCKIPRFLQENYLTGHPPPAITTLHDWQKDLLESKEWNDGNNCVVHVPTAGGKTLVAEVAIAQLLNQDRNAKAIYCVPFVSLAAEKHQEFRERFPSYSVRGFYQNVGPTAFTHGSIAVCTYERAHSVINTALKTQTLHRIKLIIIDEMHMIGHETRGSTIEALICKVMLARESPRIIGLSATMNEEDSKNFASWIGGFAFNTKKRPSMIKQFVKCIDGQLRPVINGEVGKPFMKLISTKGDDRHIVPLVANTLRRPGNNVLLFVNNRRDTIKVSTLLANNLYSGAFNLKKCSDEIAARRNELAQLLEEGNNDRMAKFVLKGIGFHHAGLTLEERELIEKAFKENVLNVIVATTTLSAGINFLNVSLVVVCDVMRGIGENMVSLSPITYMQMAGRAGRTKEHQGSVVILQKSETKKEWDVIQDLSKNEVPTIPTTLLREADFDRFYIQCLCFIGVDNGADKLAEYSYASKIKGAQWENVLKGSVDRLMKLGLYKPPKVSKLGAAIASANLPIADGIELHGMIRRSLKNVILSDPLFVMFLCTSPSVEIRTPSYNESIWEKIIIEHENVTLEVAGIGKENFQRRIFKEMKYGKKDEDNTDKILDRVFVASILVDLTDEIELPVLEERYKIDRGTIQGLQSSSTVFSGQVTKFCEVASFHEIGAIVNLFRRRLEYGVKNDLLNLMQLNSCSQPIARALVNSGISTIYDVVVATRDKLYSIITDVDPSASLEIVENIKVNAEKLFEAEEAIRELEELNV